MTIADIKSCVTLQGNGTDKGYFFSFYADDLTDIMIEATSPSGVRTVLQNGTDFKVILASPPLIGGEIQFTGFTNYTPDYSFRIYRSEPIEQQFVFEEDERISPTTLELSLDYRCKIEQQLACKIENINYKISIIDKIPDPTSAPDGLMLVTKGNRYIFQDQRVPDPTGLAQGAILGIDNNLWKPITNIAVGRELPAGGTTGQLLGKTDDNIDYKVGWFDKPTLQNLGIPPYTGNSEKLLHVKPDESGVDWVNAPDSLPDQTGKAGDHLVTDGTSASWEAQRTPAPPNTNGKILTSQGGQWIVSDQSSGGTQELYDSSGILEGYDLTKTGNNVNIPEIKVQFFENGKIVPVTLQTRTISFASEPDGVYYLVATSDGNITKTQTLPKVGDPTNINLGLIYKENGNIRDIETRAINLINMPAQVKKLYERIGGRILDGALKADGTNGLKFESITPNVLRLWKYGINSQNPQDYEEGTYNYTNPLMFKIIDKDGNEGNIQQNVDFTPQYYDLTTGALSSLSAGKWTFQLVYATKNTNYLHITNGLGEYDNHSYFHTFDELLGKYNSLITEYLRVFGIPAGMLVIHEGEDFTQSSTVIPYGAGSGVATSSTPPSQQNDFIDDVSNGLLGTCKIEKTGVGESFSVTFTGKAVFYDSTTDKLILVDPQNVPSADVVVGNYTYVYLIKSGIVQLASSKEDIPRGDILLGIVEHLDGARINNINTVYTSSNVDAHRIKDVYKSYKPIVEGCTIYLVETTDNTDPANPITKTQLAVTSGIFFNYCADDTKQYDNYWIDIAEKPVGAGFWFRSTEPEDYGKNWDKSPASIKNVELIDAKIVATTTPTDLVDGQVTLYPVMMSGDGNIVLIVPRQSFLATSIPRIDGDEVWRNFEKDIDRVTLENYALLGFVYADKENGVATWGYGASIVSIRNKYDTAKGTTMKLPSTKFATALVEHKQGIIQEYDPLSYTLGEWGDMVGYPSDYEKDLTRAYWSTGLDDDASDGTINYQGFHDLFDNVEDRSGVGGNVYTANTLKYFPNYYNIVPNFQNNTSLPFSFKVIFDKSQISTRLLRPDFDLYFSPKKDFEYSLSISISGIPTTSIVPDHVGSNFSIFYIFLYFDPLLNPTITDTTGVIVTSSIPASRIRKNFYINKSNNLVTFNIYIDAPNGSRYDYSELNGTKITFPKIKVAKNSYYSDSGLKYKNYFYMYTLWDNSGNINYRDVLQYAETNTIDFVVEDVVNPKDHIRLKYGKLADLNISSTVMGITKGDRPTDLTAGDIVLYLNIEPKSGTNYMPATTWNCDLKHSELMMLIPAISIVDASGNEKHAELAQVITWHSARYTLRNVTSTELTGSDVIIRVKNTSDVGGLTAGMNFKLGACMADDAF